MQVYHIKSGVLNRSIFFLFQQQTTTSPTQQTSIQEQLTALQGRAITLESTLQSRVTTLESTFQNRVTTLESTLQSRVTILESSVQSVLVTLQYLISLSNSSQPAVPRVMSGRSANGNNNATTSARGTSAIRAGPAVTPVRNSARGVGVSRTVANPVKK
jgi:hypothetical protein